MAREEDGERERPNGSEMHGGRGEDFKEGRTRYCEGEEEGKGMEREGVADEGRETKRNRERGGEKAK
jgi:hypothetical protein